MRIVLSLLILVSLFRFPEECIHAASQALRIWGLSVIPSLFPYMVLCRTLADQLARTSLSPVLMICILGLLGGSPSGAAVLSRYADRLSPRTLHALCAMTGTISPMFLLNTANLWAHDAQFCRRLLLSHLIGAFLSALLVLFLGRNRVYAACSAGNDITGEDGHPVTQSISSILSVGGCIVFFSVAAKALTCSLPASSDVQNALLHSLLEISGGLSALLGLSFHRTLPGAAVCSALCAFGGISILTQNHLLLQSSGVSIVQLTAFSLLRALLAAAAMLVLCIV